MGKHWLLLRGLGRDKRHWGAFIKQFERVFSHDTVSVIDTCGNGDFATLKSPLLISEYTEHCRLQTLKCSSEFHLVALSLGGMIALDWAKRYPEEILSLTLINSSAANLTPWYSRINLRTLQKLFIRLLTQRHPQKIEYSILKATSNQFISFSKIGISNPIVSNNMNVRPSKKYPLNIIITLNNWTQYRHQQSTSTINLIRQLLAAARFKVSTLTKIVPLILTSKNDKLVSTLASLDLHKQLGGELSTHPDAGHDLPLDDAYWVIAQIQQYQVCHKSVK
jgi:pimeloyl-ACP methyl ester carboxylesterase